ncbi:hypothetical protein KEM54_000187 [Ascosphaera aggregata]|nr:hypothetical protein KEM54_000187 [Ascosphaera aggregata]
MTVRFWTLELRGEKSLAFIVNLFMTSDMNSAMSPIVISRERHRWSDDLTAEEASPGLLADSQGLQELLRYRRSTSPPRRKASCAFIGETDDAPTQIIDESTASEES